MGTQELQVIEFEVKELTPAKIVSNAEDLKKFMAAVKEKYHGWIVTENDIEIAKAERAKLNKLEKKISAERKRIQKEANADIEMLINSLKTYEKEVKEISAFIGNQLEEYEEKVREEKRFEIKKKINNIFVKKADLRNFVEWNDKWLNKTFTMKKIEEEIMEQYEKIEKKESFINHELEKANNEINFIITFESMKNLINDDYDVISAKIQNKKNEIKATEEDLRKKAEFEKQRELEEAKRQAELEKQKELSELEAKKEHEKEEAIKKAQIEAAQQKNEKDRENIKENAKINENEKYFDTTLRFPNAPFSFLKKLKELTLEYNLKYELIENIEL